MRGCKISRCTRLVSPRIKRKRKEKDGLNVRSTTLAVYIDVQIRYIPRFSLVADSRDPATV